MKSEPRHDQPIRLAVVGCGRISDRHFEAIEEHPELTLVAVCDEVPDRARTAGEQYGVPAFPSYAAMLAETDADAAVICTPSGLHPRHGIMAAERGLHVVCEKPMATRLEEADQLVQDVRRGRRASLRGEAEPPQSRAFSC